MQFQNIFKAKVILSHWKSFQQHLKLLRGGDASACRTLASAGSKNEGAAILRELTFWRHLCGHCEMRVEE
jgi:hypothetical protein